MALVKFLVLSVAELDNFPIMEATKPVLLAAMDRVGACSKDCGCGQYTEAGNDYCECGFLPRPLVTKASKGKFFSL